MVWALRKQGALRKFQAKPTVSTTQNRSQQISTQKFQQVLFQELSLKYYQTLDFSKSRIRAVTVALLLRIDSTSTCTRLGVALQALAGGS